MASFCEWTLESPLSDPVAVKLAKFIEDGLQRIKAVTAS